MTAREALGQVTGSIVAVPTVDLRPIEPDNSYHG